MPARPRPRLPPAGGVRPRRLPHHRARHALPPSASSTPADDAWARVALLRRRLDAAVADERFQEAAQLKDAVAAAARGLPAGRQLVLSALEAASPRGGASASDRADALLRAAPHAAEFAWPALAALLADPGSPEPVAAAAEAALRAAFRAPPSPAAAAAMDEGDASLAAAAAPGLGGARARAALGRAVAAYSKAIDAAPGYAEAWNARATARFLARDLAESLEDCETVLDLNPYHWAAASGAGMVHLGLAAAADAIGDVAGGACHRDAALACLEAAMTLHPRLDGIAATADRLRGAGATGSGGRLPWLVDRGRKAAAAAAAAAEEPGEGGA